MANPFLVLGGIAVGIVTAAFGILQVPGWVDSAKDASAKNDIAQVSILEAAALSQTGKIVTNVADGADLGVEVSTQNEATILPNGDKQYAVHVESGSGKHFVRVDGGAIKQVAEEPADYAAAVAAADISE